MYAISRLLSLAILCFALGARWSTYRRLARAPTYDNRLKPFAIYSLISWSVWSLLFIGYSINSWGSGEEGAAPIDRGAIPYWILIAGSGIQSGLLLNAAWIINSSRIHRWVETLSWLGVWCGAWLIGSFFLGADGGEVFSLKTYDGVVAVVGFWGFVPALRRMELGWSFTVPFVLYGGVQVMWVLEDVLSTYFGPQFSQPILAGQFYWAAILPVLRSLVLFAWVRVISRLGTSAEMSFLSTAKGLARAQASGILDRAFRVMISSTVEDLQQERKAVDEAIASLEGQRFRSEMMGSEPGTPRQVCEEMARTCDIFVLIIGARYGHETTDGVSVVECEYNAAFRQDRDKILVYLKKVRRTDERLKRFVARIANFDRGHFFSTFESPEVLSQRVRRDVVQLLTRWARARSQSKA